MRKKKYNSVHQCSFTNSPMVVYEIDVVSFDIYLFANSANK